jgi:hypothetical protein
MGHRQATLGHHLDEVSQAQLEPKIPAHAQNDDFAVEVSARKQIVQILQLPITDLSRSGASIATDRHRLHHSHIREAEIMFLRLANIVVCAGRFDPSSTVASFG